VEASRAVGAGEVGVQKADLTAVLKNVPPGAWVALARQENRVVGTGKTVEEALASAKKNGENSPSADEGSTGWRAGFLTP